MVLGTAHPCRLRPGVAAAHARALAALLVALLAPCTADALEAWDGRLAAHGYAELQLRWLSDGFDAGAWYASQWANVLNLEIEADLAPEGWGPFDLASAFARIEVRYDCIYTGCGIAGTHRYFGDRASRAPARNWRDGVTATFAGDRRGVKPREAVHGGHSDLLPMRASPRLSPLIELGARNLDATLAPVGEDLFAFKAFDGTREAESIPLGPWRPESRIRPIGALRSVENPTEPLPLRPAIPDAAAGDREAQGLYVPSDPLRRRLDDFDAFDQNLSQRELEWNHGAGQDEHELKEVYLDLEMFDSRLWLRIGKQNIVWGKTELFRTTDQLNPQDIGLSSLPTLEESRLALWSLRGVWSFWEVGPLLDVRLELVVNLDDFEPIDLGRCGEPYTVWLVCAKTAGLWAHGVLGTGLAGEVRPPDPWDDLQGVEVGARLEWRWGRFSFALTDFWGYGDAPVVEAFHHYRRRVDPQTGRPLDTRGRALVAARARDFHPGNRQLFDVACSATIGVAEAFFAELADACLLDLLNVGTPLGLLPPPSDPTPAQALSLALAGGPLGELVGTILLGATPPGELFVDLHAGPRDGATSVPFGTGLAGVLSDSQEALLGCGPFYGTDCDVDGVDLLNAEASVLLQSFPFLGEDVPAGTRFAGGALRILPGARGPGDPGYDPLVDGRPPVGFRSEMAALSRNFARLLAILGIRNGDPDCSLDELGACDTVRGVLAVTSVTRPELRAGGNGRMGRRDFIWQAGGEAQLAYTRRNVLGLSMDVAEDRTRSNWSFEFTWVDDDRFGDTRTRSLTREGDAYNLTVSVDRPTFVRFLNANRTFFLNAQVFFGYLPDQGRGSTTNGPLDVLWTLAASTGYLQDRLLASAVWIHDLRSASGGVLPSVTWRFTQSFSASFGAAIFYGGPQNQDVPFHPLAPANYGGDFRARTRYAGLSPIAERDELYLKLRYTF